MVKPTRKRSLKNRRKTKKTRRTRCKKGGDTIKNADYKVYNDFLNYLQKENKENEENPIYFYLYGDDGNIKKDNDNNIIELINIDEFTKNEKIMKYFEYINKWNEKRIKDTTNETNGMVNIDKITKFIKKINNNINRYKNLTFFLDKKYRHDDDNADIDIKKLSDKDIKYIKSINNQKPTYINELKDYTIQSNIDYIVESIEAILNFYERIKQQNYETQDK
jgi:hypothetical protein